MSDTREDFVASFKAYDGSAAPGFTIRADTAAGLVDKIEAARAVGLFAVIGNADQEYRAAYALGAGLGATPVEHPSTVQNRPAQGQSRPAASTTPPGMVAPSCPHGTKTWKTSKPGAKKEWKAWMCPAPQGDPTQCGPEWVND